jgi:protoporphyrinogen oxidase
MTASRRDFIKYVVAGSVLAGYPLDQSLLAAPAPEPKLGGEQNEICHQVRDAQQFARPPVSRRYDIAIVGGGVSGLSAAYLLQNYNIVLLEKEPHWGGNAYLEEFEGQAYGTGTAFEDDVAGTQLAGEIGVTLLPVASPEAAIIHGVWVPDAWRSGLDHLPYPRAVRESFKKFRDAILKVDLESRMVELDNQPLSKYTEGYAPEVSRWCDALGASTWGARTRDSAAYNAILELQGIAGEELRVQATLPGGLGVVTKRLSEILLERHRESMLAGATTISVDPQKDEVHIRYIRGGSVETIAAKAVIMATPKFITRRIVAGIPEAQDAAMKRIRYAPYAVVNLIFDRPVYKRAYDTWCPGNTFTDFIVADWTIRDQPGYKPKFNILTCYTPLQEFERARLLTDEESRLLAAAVLRDFQKLQPGSRVDPIEVHIYRRGHPLFMSTPGTYTVTIPAARPPLARVFFANADSQGPESTTSNAVVASRRAAEWAEKLLAGAPRAQILPAATADSG